jgi:hypothetical protein
MTTGSSRHLAAALLLSALLLPVAAHAEPNAADLETARGLYVEGLQLRDAAKLDVSLARFKAAYALAPTPITGLELGRAHALVGDLAEAREVLLAVERMPVLPTESAKAASARVEARSLAEQLRTRLTATKPAPPPPREEPPPPRVDPKPSGDRGPLTPWFYVGLGTAGVGVLTGTITGVVALAKAGSLDSQCTDNQCPRSAEGDLSTSRTMGTVSTIAFVVAGAGVAVAVVSWLWRPDAATAVRTTPNALRWSW